MVSKGKTTSTTPSTSSSSSSLSLPPAVTTTASVGSLWTSMSSDEKLRDYVHSFLANFLSQSGNVRSNPSLSAPPVVPHCPPPPAVWGGCWGLGADTLYRGRLTESSGLVPPTTQEENPPRPIVAVHDDYVRSGVDRFSWPPYPWPRPLI